MGGKRKWKMRGERGEFPYHKTIPQLERNSVTWSFEQGKSRPQAFQ